jgi:hypothetical protein
MLKEILLRMVIGGSLVSAFALLGDIFNPRRFTPILQEVGASAPT